MEQLKRGARYLDLRVGSRRKDSTLVDDAIIIHGVLKGAPFANIIDEIEKFLMDNANEFLIVEIACDPNKHNMSSVLRFQVLQLISTTFSQKMITTEDIDSWFNLNKVTLGQLSEKKRNVLILINDGFCKEFTYDDTHYDQSTIARDFNCHKNANFMANKWHNTSHAGILLRSNELYLDEGCNNCDVFVNSQFVMTPQPPSGVGDVLGLLIGAKSLRPVSLARELYRKDLLEVFIRNNAEKRWNIVMLDFVDLCPQLVKFLIGLNSTKQLKIKEASVASKDCSTNLDVTETINDLKRRNNCVYILDFEKDLKISIHEGTLTVKAQYGNEECVDHVVPFNKDTEYLLCNI